MTAFIMGTGPQRAILLKDSHRTVSRRSVIRPFLPEEPSSVIVTVSVPGMLRSLSRDDAPRSTRSQSVPAARPGNPAAPRPPPISNHFPEFNLYPQPRGPSSLSDRPSFVSASISVPLPTTSKIISMEFPVTLLIVKGLRVTGNDP